MNRFLNFLSNALIGYFLGSFVDFFADTTMIFSLVGLGAGIIVALILNIIFKKKEEKK